MLSILADLNAQSAASESRSVADRAQAKCITFDVPGAVNGVFAASINPAEEIAGSYFDGNFVSHGFLRKSLGTIIRLDVEWSKIWNALKRRDVRLSQSTARVSLSQVSPG